MAKHHGPAAARRRAHEPSVSRLAAGAMGRPWGGRGAGCGRLRPSTLGAPRAVRLESSDLALDQQLSCTGRLTGRLSRPAPRRDGPRSAHRHGCTAARGRGCWNPGSGSLWEPVGACLRPGRSGRQHHRACAAIELSIELSMLPSTLPSTLPSMLLLPMPFRRHPGPPSRRFPLRPAGSVAGSERTAAIVPSRVSPRRVLSRRNGQLTGRWQSACVCPLCPLATWCRWRSPVWCEVTPSQVQCALVAKPVEPRPANPTPRREWGKRRVGRPGRPGLGCG